MLPNPGTKHSVFLRVEWAPIRITPSPPRPFIRHSLLVVDRSPLLIKFPSGNLPVSDSGLLIHDYSAKVNPIKLVNQVILCLV
jgi:hypothetical protein